MGSEAPADPRCNVEGVLPLANAIRQGWFWNVGKEDSVVAPAG